MKHFTLATALLTAALMCSVAYSQVGFQDVLETPSMKSPLASKTLFNGIALAGNRLVSVGQRGHIVYSDDEGKSWTQAYVPVSSDLTAVTFATSQRGWAVGHDGVVLHSMDGGATWIKQFDGRAAAQVMTSHHKALNNCSRCHDKLEISERASQDPDATVMADIKSFAEQGPDKPFLDVWFENESSGFIVGAFNLIFRTVDGGKTWDPWYDRTENRMRFHLYSIRPIGEDVYICGEQGMVLKLDRWSGQFRALNVPYNATFFGLTGKPGSVIAYGMRGNVFRSQDGGANWQKVETGIPSGLVGSTVTADGRIVLLSQAGQLLMSEDDGDNFSVLKQEKPFPAAALVALDNEGLMLAGLHGMQARTLK